MTTLPLAKEFLHLVRVGRKTSTIRRGNRSWEVGPAVLTSGRDRIAVIITGIRHTRFGSLTETDAQEDGFASLLELDAVLKRFYPYINETDPVTIVKFRTV